VKDKYISDFFFGKNADASSGKVKTGKIENRALINKP